AGNWAYPAASMSPEATAFTLVNGLAGRLYLTGFLHELDAGQSALVSAAAAVYKDIRATLATAVPFWPLGVPAWTDPWIALGLCAADGSEAHVFLWHRPAGDDPSVKLTLPLGEWTQAQTVFPTDLDPWTVELLGDALTVTASTGEEPTARVVRLSR